MEEGRLRLGVRLRTERKIRNCDLRGGKGFGARLLALGWPLAPSVGTHSGCVGIFGRVTRRSPRRRRSGYRLAPFSGCGIGEGEIKIRIKIKIGIED